MVLTTVKLVGAVLYAAITGIFFRPRGVWYQHHIASAFLRARGRFRRVDGQTPLLAPDTTQVYRDFARSKGFEPVIVPIKGGANGLWIGSPRASTVVLYFHGGAYVNSAVPAHMQMLTKVTKVAESQEKELAVFVVAYKLAQQSPYPQQLIQARHALEYLLSTGGLQPEDIILGGDSAGANLAVGLLSHLTHPHPDIEPLDLGGKKLRGTYLISPWITFSYDTESARANKDIDFVAATGLDNASGVFLGNAKQDNYNVPLMADADWWKGMPSRSLLLTGGSYEIMADDIVAFSEKLKVHNPDTEVFIGEYEVHVQSAMNTHLGNPLAETEKALHRWLRKTL